MAEVRVEPSWTCFYASAKIEIRHSERALHSLTEVA